MPKRSSTSTNEETLKTAKPDEVLEKWKPNSRAGEWKLPEPKNGVGEAFETTRGGKSVRVQIRGETITALIRIMRATMPQHLEYLEAHKELYRKKGEGGEKNVPQAGDSRWYSIANVNNLDRSNQYGNKVFLEMGYLANDIAECQDYSKRRPDMGSGYCRIDYYEGSSIKPKLPTEGRWAIIRIDYRDRGVVEKDKNDNIGIKKRK